MPRLAILCVEDDPEVREALLRDLTPFAPIARIEAAEDVPDARNVIEDIVFEGDRLALALCDHLMPGENGVDLLVEMHHRIETMPTRKVLVTGQAGQQDTIKAVNSANLDYYIAKPWAVENLHEVVRRLLTDYVIAEMDDLLPYVQALDGPRLMEAMRRRE